MQNWGCCRTCMNTDNLLPISKESEVNTHFIDSIFTVCAVKLTVNDRLPRDMCTSCVNFINEVIKFRKKVAEIQTILLEKLEYQENVKSETPDFELVNDISTIVPFDHDVKRLNEIDITQQKDLVSSLNKDEIELNSIGEKITNNYDNDDEYDINCEEENTKTKVKHKRKKAPLKDKTTKRKLKIKKGSTDDGIGEDMAKDKIECEYCHKILTSKLSLRNHHKIHTGFDVVCEHCGKKFITRRLLLMHCKAKHGYEKTDKCTYCDYRASNAEQVKIHERLHTGEKPFLCKECGAAFHRKSSYLQHIAIHLPEKTVQCDLCPSRFKSTTLMRIHLSRHRAPAHAFRCALCGNSFARRRNVARHVRRVHAMSPEHCHATKIDIASS